MTIGRHRMDTDDAAPRAKPRARPRATPRARSASLRWTAALVTVTTVAAGAVVAVTVAAHHPRHRAACAGTDPLDVVAAPDIAPVVTQAARAVGGTDPAGCPRIAVTAQDPAETASRLREVGGVPGPSRQPLPDVWVPPSTTWLRLTGAAGSGVFPTSGISLARSPLVVAGPGSLARSLGWPDAPVTWAALAGDLTDGSAGVGANQHPVRLSVPSPEASTVGMLTVLAVNVAMRRSEPDPGIAQMRALTFRSRLADPQANLASLLRRMAAQTDGPAAARQVGAFPLTEQQLWSYNRAGHRVPLVGIYPPDATVEADYPMVLSTVAAADERHAALAARLAGWFHTPPATAALGAHGLRRAGTGGPAPDGLGLVDDYPAPVPLPDGPAARAAVTSWAGYRPLAFQVLVLVDGSGSMNAPVRDRSGRLTTKAALLRAAGAQAGELFGDETSVGLWEFSTHRPGTPYQAVVPFGPIDAPLGATTRRADMINAAAHFQAFDGSGTPMYETALRAVARLRDSYRPGVLSLVVLLTDGHDESSPFHLDTPAFLSRLSKVEDRKRPVPIFAVGYGADADLGALTAMARATGGQAIASTAPADLATAIARIFLAAHQSR